jgi:hypothetical protein
MAWRFAPAILDFGLTECRKLHRVRFPLIQNPKSYCGGRGMRAGVIEA